MKTKLINWLKENWQTITALLFSFIFGVLCSSCNVTRTIENRSEFYQKGDTAVQITTKTTETYNAIKNK